MSSALHAVPACTKDIVLHSSPHPLMADKRPGQNGSHVTLLTLVSEEDKSFFFSFLELNEFGFEGAASSTPPCGRIEDQHDVHSACISIKSTLCSTKNPHTQYTHPVHYV